MVATQKRLPCKMVVRHCTQKVHTPITMQWSTSQQTHARISASTREYVTKARRIKLATAALEPDKSSIEQRCRCT